MVEEFVAEYAKLIVSEPELIRVESVQKDSTIKELTIYASQNDVGKLIGKDGKMIGSIKTLISGCKAKDGFGYKINVESVK